MGFGKQTQVLQEEEVILKIELSLQSSVKQP